MAEPSATHHERSLGDNLLKHSSPTFLLVYGDILLLLFFLLAEMRVSATPHH
jgi:hypothetical protein